MTGTTHDDNAFDVEFKDSNNFQKYGLVIDKPTEEFKASIVESKRFSSRCIACSQEAEVPALPKVPRASLFNSKSNGKVFAVICAAASSGKVGVVHIGRNSLGGPFWINQDSLGKTWIPSKGENVVRETP